MVSPVLAVSFGGSFLWGALAASSLLIGALIAMQVHISVRVIGAIMGFGAGVLISAVAFDLVEDSYDLAGGGRAVGFGLIAGCATFAVGNFLIAKLGGSQRKDPTGPGEGDGGGDSGGALGIVLGSVLDGIPESMVIGLTLVGGASLGVSYLAAVFLSNLPEGISSTQGLLTGRMAEGAAHPALVAHRLRVRVGVTRRLRLPRHRVARRRRVRAELRGRSDPHDARRHDDARGVRARRRDRRRRHDARLHPRLRPSRPGVGLDEKRSVTGRDPVRSRATMRHGDRRGRPDAL